MKHTHTFLTSPLLALVSLGIGQSAFSQAPATGLRPAPALTKPATPAEAAPKTAEEAYAIGQKAFYAGDMVKAKKYLLESLRINPNQVPAQALLAQIAQAKAVDVGAELKGKLQKTILPDYTVKEVSFSEAVEHYKTVVQKAGGPPVNIIVKASQEITAKITISVKGIPADEALRYVADLAGCTLKYDRAAVIITPLNDVPVKP